MPEIRATLHLCHFSGDGRECKANEVVPARADMAQLHSGEKGKKENEVGYAWWQVIKAVKKGHEF